MVQRARLARENRSGGMPISQNCCIDLFDNALLHASVRTAAGISGHGKTAASQRGRYRARHEWLRGAAPKSKIQARTLAKMSALRDARGTHRAAIHSRIAATPCCRQHSEVRASRRARVSDLRNSIKSASAPNRAAPAVGWYTGSKPL